MSSAAAMSSQVPVQGGQVNWGAGPGLIGGVIGGAGSITPSAQGYQSPEQWMASVFQQQQQPQQQPYMQGPFGWGGVGGYAPMSSVMGGVWDPTTPGGSTYNMPSYGGYSGVGGNPYTNPSMGAQSTAYQPTPYQPSYSPSVGGFRPMLR